MAYQAGLLAITDHAMRNLHYIYNRNSTERISKDYTNMSIRDLGNRKKFKWITFRKK